MNPRLLCIVAIVCLTGCGAKETPTVVDQRQDQQIVATVDALERVDTEVNQLAANESQPSTNGPMTIDGRPVVKGGPWGNEAPWMYVPAEDENGNGLYLKYGAQEPYRPGVDGGTPPKPRGDSTPPPPGAGREPLPRESTSPQLPPPPGYQQPEAPTPQPGTPRPDYGSGSGSYVTRNPDGSGGINIIIENNNNSKNNGDGEDDEDDAALRAELERLRTEYERILTTTTSGPMDITDEFSFALLASKWKSLYFAKKWHQGPPLAAVGVRWGDAQIINGPGGVAYECYWTNERHDAYFIRTPARRFYARST